MNLTQEEQQIALVLWGRELFCQRMGLSSQDIAEHCRINSLMSPADNVRRDAQNNITALLTEIIRHVDLTPAAKAMGISSQTLKNILQNHNVVNGPLKAEVLDINKVQDTATRTGSISLTAHIHKTNEAQLKRMGITREETSDPSKHGYRAQTGRLGEIAMMQSLQAAGYTVVTDLNDLHGYNHKGADISALPPQSTKDSQ